MSGLTAVLPASKPKKSQNERVASARTYYRRLERWMNTNKLGLEFNLSSYYEDESDLLTSKVLNALDNDGMIYEETVLTTIDVMRNLIRRQNVGLIGLVQSSKTTTQIMAVLLACMYSFLRLGKTCHPLFLIPNQKETYPGQFKDKFDQMMSIISEMKVRLKGKKKWLTLQKFLNDAAYERTQAIKEYMPEVQSVLSGRELGIFRALRNDMDQASVLILGMSPKYHRFLQVFAHATRKAGHCLIIDRDECHSAVGDGSVNDRTFSDNMFATDAETLEEEKTIYDMFTMSGGHATYMAVSATNWASLHLKIVPLRINKDYRGIDFGYFDTVENRWTTVGRESNLKVALPRITSMSEFANMTQNHDFAYIDPMLYKNSSTFYKRVQNDPDFPFYNHASYCQRMRAAIVSGILHMLEDANFANHRGMLLRFVNDNSEMDNFVSEIAPFLGDIKVIKEYGGETNHTRITELLEQYNVGPNDKYVVVATGGARMSDSFPADCGYGFDFTRQSSLIALLQGVLGRLSGYHKNPWVVMSQANFATINNYINNDFRPLGRVGGGYSNTKGMAYMRFDFGSQDPKWMQDIQKRGQSSIDHPMYRKSKNGKLILELGEKYAQNTDFLEDVIGSALDNCKELSDIRLMDVGEVDGNNRTYAVSKNDGTNVLVSVRTEGTDRSDHRGGRSGKVGDYTTIRILMRTRIDRRRSDPFIFTGFDLAVYQNEHGITVNRTVNGKINNDNRTGDIL